MPKLQESPRDIAKRAQRAYIRCQMDLKGIEPKKMAKLLDMSPETLSRKLDKDDRGFYYEELITLFDKLDLTDEQVLECMGRKRELPDTRELLKQLNRTSERILERVG